MPLPTDYAKILVVYKTPDSRPMVNVLWYIPQNAIFDGPGGAHQLALAADAKFKAPYRGVLTTGSQYIGCKVSLSSAGVTWDDGSSGAAVPGLVDGDECADFTAVVVQKRTQIPGKPGRGRFYVGGVPETFTNNSKLTEDGLLAYNSLAEAYSSALLYEELQWKPQHHSTLTQSLYEVTQFKPINVLGTQRRRRLRPEF